MSDDERMTPASPDDLEQALAFALRFDGRKRVHHGDEFMAKLTAQRLVEHLQRSGFVVMRRGPAKPHSTP
jgi:hypothetical protein